MKYYIIIPLDIAIPGNIILSNYMPYGYNSNFKYILALLNIQKRHYSEFSPPINLTVCSVECLPQNNKYQKYKIIRDYSILL
jgi:hypothetical protein